MSTDSVTRTTLDNALTVMIKEMHHAPVASFWIWYRVGSRNEVSGITGISHWTEHMLFKGTPTFPKGQIDRLISREGGVFNAFTSTDFTAYFATLPSERLDIGLRIEVDRMVNSLFDPEEVAAERMVIISEREGAENAPRFLLGEEVQAAAFRVHPYHHEVVGWKCDLQTITRDDLLQHYRTYYAPNNAIAVVAGDVDTSTITARLGKLFGAIPARSSPPPVRSVEPPQQGERRVTVEGPGTTAYLQMVFHVPAVRDADFFPLMVLQTILDGTQPLTLFGGLAPSNRSSRLYRALVETELATGVATSLAPTVDPYLFGFSATIRTGHTLSEVEDALTTQLRRVAEEPVSTGELARAIKQTRAQFAYSSESVTSQAFWLGFSEIVASTDWFVTFLDSISRVTTGDVQRVAGTYLTESNRTVGWYVPVQSGS